MQPIVVLITAPNPSVAESIARNLVERNLAACVNVLPGIRSYYRWEGAIHEDQEILLIAKTRSELLEEQFIPAVRNLHPYQTPEIIALPIIAGLTEYMDWIGQVTR